MDANRTDIFSPSRTEFHKDRYRFACNWVRNQFVLDAGCGTGYGAAILAEEGDAAFVYGVDQNFDTIRYAHNTYARSGVCFVEGTVTDLPFRDNYFDVVVSFETLEHVVDENQQLKEIVRVLKPGGFYILSTPNDWGLGERAPFHVKSYDLETLQAVVSKWLTIKEIHNQNSGTAGRKENHDQPRGIHKTTDDNWRLAECYLVVAEKPLSQGTPSASA